MDKKKYMETLTEQIRYKKALPLIEKELETHIEEQKADFMAAGMAEDEAEAAAVTEMGDPVEVGVDMDRIHRPKSVGRFMAMFVALYCASRFMLLFMGDALSFDDAVWKLFLWESGEIILLYLLMTAACYLDYSRFGRWAKELSIGGAFLMFIAVELFVVTVNGMPAWIFVGGFTLDIRALIYLFIPLYGGVLYRYRKQGYPSMGKCILWMLPPIFLSVRYSSIVLAILMALVCFMMLLWAVGNDWFQVEKKRVMGAIIGIMVLLPVISGALFWHFGSLYQQDRLRAILFSQQSENVFEMEMLRKAVLSSHVFGRSKEAVQILDMVAGGDKQLACVFSFFGIVPTLVFLGVIVLLFAILLKNVMKQKNRLGKIMGLGCILAMFVQLLVYVLTNIGILPFFSGVYCPFISCGRSSSAVMAVLFGILLSICRYQNVAAEPAVAGWKLVVRRD